MTTVIWMQTMSGFAAISRPNLLAIRAGAKKDARDTHKDFWV